jgi:ABC-type antimicrobial peptide transport system permease subunit
MMRIAAACGVLALAIAMAGIFAVISSMVTARTREIGIRVALGATLRDVRALVLDPTLRLVLFGTVLGIVAAMAGGRFVSSLLYGVTPVDPFTYTVVGLMLAATAILAVLPPMRRAARVDPAIILRVE